MLSKIKKKQAWKSFSNYDLAKKLIKFQKLINWQIANLVKILKIAKVGILKIEKIAELWNDIILGRYEFCFRTLQNLDKFWQDLTRIDFI